MSECATRRNAMKWLFTARRAAVVLFHSFYTQEPTDLHFVFAIHASESFDCM